MQKIDINEVTHNILNWAEARELDQGNPDRQLLKLMEEVGELAEAYNKQDINGFIDGLGDVYVVLTILGSQKHIPIEQAIFHAYEEIKNRSGYMIDGIYVKDGDVHG